jgi:hypothetical protein
VSFGRMLTLAFPWLEGFLGVGLLDFTLETAGVTTDFSDDSDGKD